MDYMDLAVHGPRKAVKFNHSITHSNYEKHLTSDFEDSFCIT